MFWMLFLTFIVSFESNLRLKRIESRTFFACPLSIVVPSTVVFVAYGANANRFSVARSDPHSRPMFDRWQRLVKSGITIDFQRILRYGSALPHFKDSLLNLSEFDEGSVIGRNNQVSSQIYPSGLMEH
jgi:hypothetical protein